METSPAASDFKPWIWFFSPSCSYIQSNTVALTSGQVTQRKGLLWDVRRTWFAQPGRAHLVTGQLPCSLSVLLGGKRRMRMGWGNVWAFLGLHHKVMVRLKTGKGRGHSWEWKLWPKHTLYLAILCFIIVMAVFACSANQPCSRNWCSCIGFSLTLFSMVMEAGTSCPGAKQGSKAGSILEATFNAQQLNTQCSTFRYQKQAKQPNVALRYPWCTTARSPPCHDAQIFGAWGHL